MGTEDGRRFFRTIYDLAKLDPVSKACFWHGSPARIIHAVWTVAHAPTGQKLRNTGSESRGPRRVRSRRHRGGRPPDKPRWLKHGGAPCTQSLLGTWIGESPSTKKKRQDCENHWQNCQSQAVTLPEAVQDLAAQGALHVVVQEGDAEARPASQFRRREWPMGDGDWHRAGSGGWSGQGRNEGGREPPGLLPLQAPRETGPG